MAAAHALAINSGNFMILFAVWKCLRTPPNRFFSQEIPKFQTAFFLTTFTVKTKNRKSPQTFPVFEYKNNSAEHGQSETEAIQNIKSNQNADQPGAALIDDPFQRFLQAGAGLLRHVQQLVLQPFVHQLVQALAKDVGFPQLFRVVLKAGQ